MNREQPPVNDIELLSAYIDGELSAEERIELNNRLDNEPALQAELESLQETVEILQSLPTLKAPRDFRLDPATYGRKTGRIIDFSSWRVITAAGVAAAVLLLVSGLLLSGLSSSGDVDENSSAGDNIAFDQAVQSEEPELERTEASLRPEAATISDFAGDTESSVTPISEADSDDAFAEEDAEANEVPEPNIMSDESAQQAGATGPNASGMGGGFEETVPPPPADALEESEAFDGEGQVGQTGRSADDEFRDDEQQTQEAQTAIAGPTNNQQADTVPDAVMPHEDNNRDINTLITEVIRLLLALLELLIPVVIG
jgi:hypothetical protein